MNGYYQFSLIDLLDEKGEDFVEKILSSFSCPINQDIEDFLIKKSIIFEKQSISRTYLIFTSHKDENVLVGQYTITAKPLRVSAKNLTYKLRRVINRFGVYSTEEKGYELSAYLIAQLSKNFSKNYDKLISGDDLLNMACEKVKEAQRLAGGKIVYLECEEKPRLLEFYQRNGFKEFQKREIERNERRLFKENYFIQMLKIL